MKAFVVALLAGVAVFPVTVRASENPYSATLSTPVAAAKDVIAGSTVWHCEASACATKSSTQHAGSIPACHQLMLQVGAVTAYGSAARLFDADMIAKCNAQ